MTQKADIIGKIDEKLGAFALPPYEERAYKKAYYAIREMQGLILSNGDKFDWNDYKASFEETFGTIEEPKFSLQELLEYAKSKFNMNLDELIAFNRKSLQRRQQQQRKREMEYQAMRRQMSKVPPGYVPDLGYDYDDEFEPAY